MKSRKTHSVNSDQYFEESIRDRLVSYSLMFFINIRKQIANSEEIKIVEIPLKFSFLKTFAGVPIIIYFLSSGMNLVKVKMCY